MWTRIALWAGLMALVGTAAAHAQAVVPQYTHRGYVGAVAFDADDARVAVGSSGGFVSILDVASGRVLAVRRLLRSNDAGFMDTQLDGPVLHAMGSISGDTPEPIEWNWVEDTVEASAPSVEGWLAARGPGGQVARIDDEGNLVVGERRAPLERGVSDLAFPHRRLVAVAWRDDRIELRSAADPDRVIARLAARGMSVDAGRLAAVDHEKVHLVALPSGRIRTVPHGLGGVAQRVVLGRGAMAVVGRQRSELHRPDEAPVAIDGAIQWIGRRSALVTRAGSLVRVRLRDLSERVVRADDIDQVWVGPRGVIVARTDEMDRFTLIRRDGSRQSYAPGGEHSVWHVHAAPGGESVVLAGRFGIQRWTAGGVIDGACDGEGLLAVDWERGLGYSRYGRCTRRGVRASYPRDQMAVAATADGTVLLLSDGTFFGRRRPRARVRGLPEGPCEDDGYCPWSARFAAKGELLLIEHNPDWGTEDAENRVVLTRTGRDLFQAPVGTTFEVSPDGSRIAVLHPGGGTVRDREGTVRFTFGTESPDDDAAMPLAAFSADGQRFAWATDGTLDVLDAEGRLEQQIALDGRPGFIQLTEDAIGYADGSGTVIRRGALTRHEAAGVTLATAACVEGRFRSLGSDLSPVLGPACAGGRAERRGDLYFRKMGGAVRLWRGDRVMTLRTIRRGERTAPMAYVPDGRWWTPGAAEAEVATAPLALRRGLASAPMAAPADADLPRALFGTASGGE